MIVRSIAIPYNRIEEVEMFDVRFGDCFVCSNKYRAAMLVDCGSTIASAAVSKKLSMFYHKYLMISHFHNDHISGISQLANVHFNEVYLPNIIDPCIIGLSFATLLISRKTSPLHQLALNLLLTIPNIVSCLTYKSKIVFFKRGDVYCNRLDSFRILWPSFEDNKARTILGQLENYDRRELLQRAYAAAREYFGILEDNLTSSDGVEIIEITDNNQGQLSSLSSIVESFISRQDGELSVSKSLKNSISDWQNEISLCFDNFTDYNRQNNVLFLGDLPKDIFENKLVPYNDIPLLPAYRAIKVPHHGTKNYFTDLLPPSDYLLISNGKARKGWEISVYYGLCYRTRAICCTNYHCACEYEFYKTKCRACANPDTVCGVQNGNSIVIKI